jgi:anti-sigma regulatory factor (Ser/Thr protein kinase)
MADVTVSQRPREVRRAREVVRAALRDRGLADDHVDDVVVVVSELLGAAHECGLTGDVELSLTIFPLLTSVRIRCDRDVELRDKPFDLRERVLGQLTISFGRRRSDERTVDLWAEIARTS